MFVENEIVNYRGMTGTVVFITSNYMVIETSPAPGRNPPRLLIFHSDYSKVQREK
jgi:RNase P/RNase MRP subunit p29